eukprot:273549-Pyramimonas_sp.AAC.2
MNDYQRLASRRKVDDEREFKCSIVESSERVGLGSRPNKRILRMLDDLLLVVLFASPLPAVYLINDTK